jgi:hypothetical protein
MCQAVCGISKLGRKDRREGMDLAPVSVGLFVKL